MRLSKLHLERYGCFTDCTLNFREKACLHIVYGHNEAGKSTSLAAIADLLFGFGTRTNYAFHHSTSKLSVAAELKDKDGKIFLVSAPKRHQKHPLGSERRTTPRHSPSPVHRIHGQTGVHARIWPQSENAA